MWSILAPFFVGRAVGGWRYIRVALLLILIGCVIAAVLYAAIVFNAVRSTPETHHGQHHSTH